MEDPELDEYNFEDWREEGEVTSQERHERAKRAVGMAPYGTKQYWINAAIVLSQHAGPGMKAETKDKLQSLVIYSCPEAKEIARDALNGKRYPI